MNGKIKVTLRETPAERHAYGEGDPVRVKGHPGLEDADATVAIDDGDSVLVKVYDWKSRRGYTHRNTWVSREFVAPREA